MACRYLTLAEWTGLDLYRNTGVRRVFQAIKESKWYLKVTIEWFNWLGQRLLKTVSGTRPRNAGEIRCQCRYSWGGGGVDDTRGGSSLSSWLLICHDTGNFLNVCRIFTL